MKIRRNLFLLLAATFITAAIFPQTVNASTKTSAPSAVLAGVSQTSHNVKVDNRAQILKEYLETYDSPLAPHAATFVKQADEHDIDWKLVVAIAGVESYYGQMIPSYSYNGWGFGVYGNNVRRFESWDDGITVVTTALREEYMNARGAQNVYQIGSTYAADPNWANKVTRFMNEIEAFEQNYTDTSVSISL